MALPAGRYGVTKNQLLKIKKLPMNTIKLIEELTEKFDLLGTAAFKNSTSVVTESTDLVESGAVEQTLRDAEVIEGKNLLPLTLDSIKALNTNNWSWNGNVGTNNGVNFTISTDNNGYVTQIDVNRVSGTADAYLFLTINLDNILTNGVQYIMNGCTGGSNTTYTIYTGTIGQWDCSNGDALATYDSNWTRLYIGIRTNASPNHVKMYPMIRKATETDPTYEPYYIPLKDALPNKCDNSVIGTVEDGINPTKSYAVGEHFIRNGKFCTCIVPVTTESTWSDSYYVEGTIADNLVKQDTFSGTTSSTGIVEIYNGNRNVIKCESSGGNRIIQPFYSYSRSKVMARCIYENGSVIENDVVSGTYYYYDI